MENSLNSPGKTSSVEKNKYEMFIFYKPPRKITSAAEEIKDKALPINFRDNNFCCNKSLLQIRNNIKNVLFPPPEVRE